MRVDIWSDIVCPWCYIGKRRFETALAAFDGRDDIEIHHHSFQLDPSAPLDRTSSRGEMLMKKYRLTPAQLEATDSRMQQIAAEEGLDYHLAGTVSGNTLAAHQLVHLAREHGKQDAMIERLYRAYFSERASVFDTDSLVALAQDIGLDPQEARAALGDGRYVSAVRQDLELAGNIGITGVPFFVINGKYGLSGAQPPSAFLEAFAQAAEEDAGDDLS